VVVGTSAVREALREGRVVLVVLAGDHARRTEEKVGRLARARAVPVLLGPPAEELGRRMGRPSVQALGVQDQHLAAGIRPGERVEGRTGNTGVKRQW
jgi:ribosomal protein L7Ae-like RNA K-turn-binding protein